eukprot:5017671-Pyramimonas_sp.AAC.1
MAHRSSPRSTSSASGPEAPPAPPAARRVREGQPPVTQSLTCVWVLSPEQLSTATLCLRIGRFAFAGQAQLLGPSTRRKLAIATNTKPPAHMRTCCRPGGPGVVPAGSTKRATLE